MLLAGCDGYGDDDSTTATPAGGEQAALWPPEGEEIDDPAEVASSFYVEFLNQHFPHLGAFQQGDPSSGEVPVFLNREDGSRGPRAGTVLVREQGDGWVVTGVVSDAIVIAEPEAGAEVPAGSVTVSGRGRGFEGNLIIRAVPAGEGGAAQLDQKIATAGALEDLEPYSVSVDLSDAEPGSTVAILVFNTSAADGSIGNLAAIPVRIASQ